MEFKKHELRILLNALNQYSLFIDYILNESKINILEREFNLHLGLDEEIKNFNCDFEILKEKISKEYNK